LTVNGAYETGTVLKERICSVWKAVSNRRTYRVLDKQWGANGRMSNNQNSGDSDDNENKTNRIESNRTESANAALVLAVVYLKFQEKTQNAL
jgi:hypothetical protein